MKSPPERTLTPSIRFFSFLYYFISWFFVYSVYQRRRQLLPYLFILRNGLACFDFRCFLVEFILTINVLPHFYSLLIKRHSSWNYLFLSKPMISILFNMNSTLYKKCRFLRYQPLRQPSHTHILPILIYCSDQLHLCWN